MATIENNENISVSITLHLDEAEARALYALTVYGTEQFLGVFYEYLGKDYLQKYQLGLESLFNSVHSILPKTFDRIDRARKEFDAN